MEEVGDSDSPVGEERIVGVMVVQTERLLEKLFNDFVWAFMGRRGLNGYSAIIRLIRHCFGSDFGLECFVVMCESSKA